MLGESLVLRQNNKVVGFSSEPIMAIISENNWDLLVYNRDNQLILVVEVKRKTNVSTEWVAKFRRNLLAHGIFPQAPYFMIALLDKFYLWTTNAGADFELLSEPNYIIDARPILKPYFEKAGIKAEKISEKSLEIIIISWLGEIMYSEKLPENMDNFQGWLIDSGLYAALAGGKFQHEAVT
ncbi:MAG: hypothetical protein QNJ36_21570 [Calothrix sp. MO_167.B42]|nr:hypothetical protein [Calothrix sp. MO_167.B42]